MVGRKIVYASLRGLDAINSERRCCCSCFSSAVFFFELFLLDLVSFVVALVDFFFAEAFGGMLCCVVFVTACNITEITMFQRDDDDANA